MKVSELDIYEVLNVLNGLSPIKIILNGTSIYNDYDADELEDGAIVYGEIFPPNEIIPKRLNYKKYMITDIHIKAIQFHRSIIEMQGEEV